jgi:hypothetical protein
VGKRSDFKRLVRDAYQTPAKAAAPLLPHLAPATRFIEPCVGAGRLTEHLTAAGHMCIGAFDLPDDARTKRYDVPTGAIFCTNPPFWGRPDLREIIVNLSDQAPAWLLLPADWIHNVSSAPLMPRLRVIVSIGRVKWIEDSESTGKDNAIWCLFEHPSPWASIQFIGRSQNRTIRDPAEKLDPLIAAIAFVAEAAE